MINLRDFSYPKANPSLLACDQSKINEEATFAGINGANFIHIDIMDGKFVSNVSFSLEIAASIERPVLDHPFVKDTHLMVVHPERVVGDYAKISDIVTFHLEAGIDKKNILLCRDLIHESGANAGLAINPNTELEAIFPYLEEFDLVLLMTVMPGKGGQPFDPNGYARIKRLKEEIMRTKKKPILEIDGGVNDKTSPLAKNSGAELLVAGSYLFGHEDFRERLEGLEKND